MLVVGPTAVGKTDYCIDLALSHSSPIISCDSRQIYREMPIGTAVPSPEQLAAVKHYFIQDHSIFEAYSAGRYAVEAGALVDKLFSEGHDTLIMTGGSGFFIQAFENGLDDFPEADPELRKTLTERLKNEGVEALRCELKLLDPESYETIDIANGQRVVRALEVCLQTGRKFSSFKTSPSIKRDYDIDKIGLIRPREELYRRADLRVLDMMEQGLEKEARRLHPHKDLPALQSVGYKELFDYFDGVPDPLNETGLTGIDRAVNLIQRNTRRYIKRQLTWFLRDKNIKWHEM